MAIVQKHFKFKKNMRSTLAGCLLVIITALPLSAKGSHEITNYYVRLDIKSSNHRITDSKLTMIPAENEYRTEGLQPVSVSRLLVAVEQAARQEIERQARDQALMQILEQNGLKSVTAVNHETIISYEGLVLIPVDLRFSPYDESRQGYPYVANIYFASIAFPDDWDAMKYRSRIREMLNDFIQLFN